MGEPTVEGTSGTTGNIPGGDINFPPVESTEEATPDVETEPVEDTEVDGDQEA